jgi:hypothetical protein
MRVRYAVTLVSFHHGCWQAVMCVLMLTRCQYRCCARGNMRFSTPANDQASRSGMHQSRATFEPRPAFRSVMRMLPSAYATWFCHVVAKRESEQLLRLCNRITD